MRDTFQINFTYAMLRTMLSSEFYIGKYRNNTHYCPAYLTNAQWDAIQSINKNNIKKAASGRIYYFSGLIRCPECGVLLAGSGCSSIINRKTKEKRTYCYYRCNNWAMNHNCTYSHRLSQNLLEQYLLNNLSLEYKRFLSGLKSVQDTQKPISKRRTKSAITSEMKRLNLLFQKGRIEFEYYNEEYDKLETELKELEQIIQPVKNYSHVEDLLAQDFKSLYISLNEEGKQIFWHEIIETLEMDEKNIKRVIFRSKVSD